MIETPRIREVETRLAPERQPDQVHFGDRGEVIEIIARDFACLPEWDYIISEGAPDLWAIWQEPREGGGK